MKKTDYLTMSTTQIVKIRFKEYKTELLKKAKGKEKITQETFALFVCETEPVYNCKVGWKKIENAWIGRTPDLFLTELLLEYKTYKLGKLK